jgi:Tfp pilus assembly protein PilO
MNSSGRLIVAILAVGAVAIGFWMLLLGPKREEADRLSGERDSLALTLAQAQSAVTEAEAARRAFPADYRQLVVLGAAVPEGDETSSLLVELSRTAEASKVQFDAIQLTSSGGEAAAVEVPAAEAPPEAETSPSGAVPAAASVPPTEAAASLLPLGATIGPAGLAVMPYSITLKGNFFQIADFIHQIDSLVDPANAKVGVEGRLITIDGFSLTASKDEETGASAGLDANFVVTTYVTPPGQGVTAGATPTEPSAAPVATPAGEEAAASSETVSAR